MSSRNAFFRGLGSFLGFLERSELTLRAAKSPVPTSQDYSDVLVDGSSELPLNGMLHLHIVLVVLPAVLLALQMVLFVVMQLY